MVFNIFLSTPQEPGSSPDFVSYEAENAFSKGSGSQVKALFTCRIENLAGIRLSRTGFAYRCSKPSEQRSDLCFSRFMFMLLLKALSHSCELP